MGLIDDLKASVDDILGVRDSIGAVLQPIYIVTRTWSGTTPGDGTAVDTEAQVLPSPGIKDYSHDLRMREGGVVKAGDIMLTGVSGNLYTESQLDGTSSAGNIEKLYRVGTKMYQVINVVQKYVTWEVQLRLLTNQTRYIGGV